MRSCIYTYRQLLFCIRFLGPTYIVETLDQDDGELTLAEQKLVSLEVDYNW